EQTREERCGGHEIDTPGHPRYVRTFAHPPAQGGTTARKMDRRSSLASTAAAGGTVLISACGGGSSSGGGGGDSGAARPAIGKEPGDMRVYEAQGEGRRT